jgi:hypothetical protein
MKNNEFKRETWWIVIVALVLAVLLSFGIVFYDTFGKSPLLSIISMILGVVVLANFIFHFVKEEEK